MCRAREPSAVTVCGKLVVEEVAVEIGSRDKRSYLALVLGDNSLESRDIVPIDIDIVRNVLFKDTGIVDLLGPGRNTVIEAIDEDYLLAMGVGSCGHDSGGGDIVAVLCEESPVCAVDGVNKPALRTQPPCRTERWCSCTSLPARERRRQRRGHCNRGHWGRKRTYSR